MIISCPSCAKRYEVESRQIPERGRKVKCILCANEWRQMPDPVAWVESDPVIRQLHDVTSHTISPRPRLMKKIINGSIASVLLAVLAILVLFPSDVVRVLPKLQTVYGWMGVNVSAGGEGLALTNLKTNHEGDPAGGHLHIEGDVMNTTDHVIYLPPLHVSFLSNKIRCAQKTPEGACVVERFDHTLKEVSLLPGEQAHFALKKELKKLGVTFVSVEF